MAQVRQNEIISSNLINLQLELRKVRSYLLCSLLSNVLGLFLLIWLFWTLEPLLLFLLAYKYLESFLSTLIVLSELQMTIYASTQSDSAFEESYMKVVLEAVKLLLEGSYVVAIAFNKKISISNYCTTIYLGVRAISLISEAWKAYKKIYEERRINNNILSM